jgi:hypothetical protein
MSPSDEHPAHARPTDRGVAAGMTWRRAAGSLSLFLLALAAYLANGRTIGAGDTLPAAHVPWSLTLERSFRLDAFPALHGDAATRIYPLLDGIPYYLLSRNGHYLSAYTPGPGVVATPVYLLPIVSGADPAVWAGRLEKLAAAIITALSVVFLYWALRGVTTPGWAYALSVVYALGTSSLSMSGQALWQHGPSQLFVSLGLYCLVRGRSDDRYLGYAGLPMAAAVAMRSTDLLLLAPVAAWIVYAHRRQAWRFAMWALLPAIALAAYHAAYFAGPDRGIGHTSAPVWALFAQTPLADGLPGVLTSPGRGLFVYSPILLFSLAGMALVWRREPAVWRALSLGPPLVVLAIAKWMTWWGGHSWGPRLLADITPVLCFLLYPVTPILDRRRLLRALFIVLALASITAHALGAWLYDGRWDGLSADHLRTRLWSWSEGPLAFYGREGLLRLGLPVGSRARPGDPPETLAASCRIGPVPADVQSGERFVVSLLATNTGTATWRAVAPDERGAVRLGWRWYRGDREVAAGRDPLFADVPPRRSAEFVASVIAPIEPGEYTLAFDLVSEHVAWFADRSQAPIRRSVIVRARDITAMLSAPTTALRRAPLAHISTDRVSYRGGDPIHLSVALANPGRPRSFDAYLILEPGDGAPLFFDGHRMPRASAGAWPPWVRGLPLPARADGRFTLKLDGLPPGRYRWHAVLTEPGAHRAVARTTAEFTLDP